MIAIKNKIVSQRIEGTKVAPTLAPQEQPLAQPQIELKRNPILHGKTYKLKSPLAEHALYVTINAIQIGEKNYPFEIFFNSRDAMQLQWANALTVTISTCFRNAITHNFQLSDLLSNLKQTIDANPGYRSYITTANGGKPTYVNCLVAEIALAIENFLSSISFSQEPTVQVYDSIAGQAMHCKKCNEIAVIFENGCLVCKACGDSKCE